MLCYYSPRYACAVIREGYEVTNFLKYTCDMIAVFTFTKKKKLSQILFLFSQFFENSIDILRLANYCSKS